MNIDILGISELKWTGIGEFNSDDHYICQEAFNKRLPVCCFGSVRNPLALINS